MLSSIMNRRMKLFIPNHALSFCIPFIVTDQLSVFCHHICRASLTHRVTIRPHFWRTCPHFLCVGKLIFAKSPIVQISSEVTFFKNLSLTVAFIFGVSQYDNVIILEFLTIVTLHIYVKTKTIVFQWVLFPSEISTFLEKT